MHLFTSIQLDYNKFKRYRMLRGKGNFGCTSTWKDPRDQENLEDIKDVVTVDSERPRMKADLRAG